MGDPTPTASKAPRQKILIIDDEPSIRSAVRMILKYENFVTEEAGTGADGIKILKKEADVAAVLCDVKMPGMDGIETLVEMKLVRPDLPVIMISGHGTVETAVEATRRGAFDFLEKPLDRDRLLLTVRNALGHSNLAQENDALRKGIAGKYRIIGASHAIVGLRDTIARVADTDARILISGENGTGKELVARNLHLLSRRRDAAWVDVNCAAIPSELIESELFGHEKGSFTGADAKKIGKFEQADGGTLFLDEIGDMPLAAQAKVLRVLEESKVQRVGGDGTIPIDVRVVAATNKDLAKEVEAGQFREDLFYRLNVIPLHVPPLRERGDDVVELFSRFLHEACRKYHRDTMRIEGDAAAHLISQPWPGNVRELRNLAERVVLLVPDPSLTRSALEGLGARENRTLGDASLFAIQSFEQFKETAEHLYLQRKLEENGWNIKRTAETLGMQRSNLYKKIERYGLKVADDQD
jgi:DNA-binding NtrC family response regulator